MSIEIRAQLRNTLAELYQVKTSIRRIIDDAGLHAFRIDLEAAPIDIWHAILIEAENVGQIYDLLRVVEADYGNNQQLRNHCAAYRQATGQLEPKDKQDDSIVAVHQVREPLMNCDREMAAFHALLDSQDRQIRVIALQGEHGCGKTYLLDEYRRLASEQERLVVHFDLGQQLTIERCLERIAEKINYDAFPDFQQRLHSEKPDSVSKQREWQTQLTLAFFADLRRLATSTDTFVLFDRFENADRALRGWLRDDFIARLEEKALVVIIAGRSDLEPLRGMEWVRFFTPKIRAIEYFYAYAQTVGVQIEHRNMSVLYAAFQTTPKSFVEYVNILRMQQYGVLP